MKRLWIGIGFLIVMLAVGIFLTLQFSRIHEPLARDLWKASEMAAAQDWENATALTRQARADWEQYRHLIAAVADHEPLEEMEYLLDQLDIYAGEREAVHFCAVCVQIARLADAMLDSQQITWWNLLTGACPGRTVPAYQGQSESR